MNINIGKNTSPIKWLLASVALATSTPAFSEYYIGLDATYMNNITKFDNGSTKFELSPARIKFGQRFEEFGWEIQGLSPSDDTGTFTGNNNLHEYKLRGGIGILMTVSTPGRGFFGGIGFTQIVSDYSIQINGQTISSTSSTPFTTINLGGQFEIVKNLRLSMDYTFYLGRIDCSFCNDPNNAPAGAIITQPDVRLSTFGIGLNYTF